MTAESSSAAPVATGSKGVNIGLWVCQVLLALVFGMAGAMKLLTPIAELATRATVPGRRTLRFPHPRRHPRTWCGDPRLFAAAVPGDVDGRDRRGHDDGQDGKRPR